MRLSTTGNHMTSIANYLKNYWFFLPLLCTAPFLGFFAFFLMGAQFFSGGDWVTIYLMGTVILSFLIPLVLALVIKAKWYVRILLFSGLFMIQLVPMFFMPAGATAEMMGYAFHLGHEFQVDQIRECADQLRQKKQSGTLKVIPQGTFDDVLWTENAKIVDETELPVALRGRFVRVYIRPSFTSQDYRSSDDVVVFDLGKDRGIFCNDRKHISDFYVHSITDGVHAYHFQRQ